MSNPPPVSAPSAEPIVRHSGPVRFLHWALALFYLALIATGFALYWNSILGWLVPYFGGTALTIYIHLWAGFAMVLFSVLLLLRWRSTMRWTAADSHFVRHLGDYAMRPDQSPPPDTGFFNGGQKLYFWSVVATGVLFLVTGLVWSYRYEVPHAVYAVCRTTHRVLGVIMLAGLAVHLYKATLGEPGTLRSMLRGTVTREWARTRRPKWFRDLKD